MRRIITLGIVAFFLGYLYFLLQPAVLGQLRGTFMPHVVSSDYQRLASILENDKSFSRTFWVPLIHTYSYYSFQHPQISAEEFFQTTSLPDVLRLMQKKDTQHMLQSLGVRYVIVPYDSESKIFLADRKYDSTLFHQTIDALSSLHFLHRVNGFKQIAVFALEQQQDHLWLEKADGERLSVKYAFYNPTNYAIDVTKAKKGDKLIFAESFDSRWIIEKDDTKIASTKYLYNLNSFTLPSDGDYRVKLMFTPQQWVIWGAGISVGSVLLLIGLLFFAFGKRGKKW